MDDTAQDGSPLNRTSSRRAAQQPTRTPLVNALMWSSMVVILNIGRQNAMKVPFVEDQEPVETLLSHGANPPFRERIRIWRPNGCAKDRDILGGEHGVESRCKRRVAIVDQEACWQCAILDLPTEVTRLLCHPCACRVGGAAGQMHLWWLV